MIKALTLAASLLAPDCLWLCLGVCHYDWQAGYCQDTRVVRLGPWDPIPLDYVPPRESDFPAWPLQYPREWGTYVTEQTPLVYE